jgi:hypothetical protein
VALCNDAPIRRSGSPHRHLRYKPTPKCLLEPYRSTASQQAGLRRRSAASCPPEDGHWPTTCSRVLPKQGSRTRENSCGIIELRQANLGRSTARSLWMHWCLPRRLLPDAVVNIAPEDASISGLSSTDESVAIPRRFQRLIARSFHGLCSPSRCPRLSPAPAAAGSFTKASKLALGRPRFAFTMAIHGGACRVIPPGVSLRRVPACAVARRFVSLPIPAAAPFQR